MYSKYREALNLYNQCEYEKAYDVLSNSKQDLGNNGHLLLEECKKLIFQQYVYLINEAENRGNISKANQLKAMYTDKYGKNCLISEPKHDNKFFWIILIVLPLLGLSFFILIVI